jgi:hypothetical protein
MLFPRGETFTLWVFLSLIKELYSPFKAHTRVWQKWRFSAPQTHLWLIIRQLADSASTFVVKIATFAKPKNVKNLTLPHGMPAGSDLIIGQ